MEHSRSMALLERHCATADTFHQYRARMPGEPRAFIDLAPRVSLQRTPIGAYEFIYPCPLRVKVLSHKLP